MDTPTVTDGPEIVVHIAEVTCQVRDVGGREGGRGGEGREAWRKTERERDFRLLFLPIPSSCNRCALPAHGSKDGYGRSGPFWGEGREGRERRKMEGGRDRNKVRKRREREREREA